MLSLTRHSPLTSTSPLDDVFDNFFQGFLRPVRWEGSQAGQQPAQLKMDVLEGDDAYTIHAEMPGVNKDDIQVTINGNQVTISAEINKRHEEKENEKLLRTERYYGKVYRSFALAQEVDENGAEAKYDAGVLELRLPKKAATAAKKITIQ